MKWSIFGLVVGSTVFLHARSLASSTDWNSSAEIFGGIHGFLIADRGLTLGLASPRVIWVSSVAQRRAPSTGGCTTPSSSFWGLVSFSICVGDLSLSV